MKCSCCGSEINREHRLCPNCGQNNEYYVEQVQYQNTTNYYENQQNNQTINQPINRVPIYNNNQSSQNPVYVYSHTHTQIVREEKTEGKALGILSIIFAALGGWLGLLFAIIGLCIYQKRENRLLCKIGLWIYLAEVILSIILFFVLFI